MLYRWWLRLRGLCLYDTLVYRFSRTALLSRVALTFGISNHHVLPQEVCLYPCVSLAVFMLISTVYSWLPLLFIPTNASPLFILSFVTLTYLLHRPCIYCSVLLLILFLSSCHWSDRCFLDFKGDWFSPRFSTPSTTAPAPQEAEAGLAEYVLDAMNTTATALASAAYDGAKKRLTPGAVSEGVPPEWTGIGLEWLRSLLGKREWTLPCVNVKVRL